MEANNEIGFLLNFDFENSGAKEAQEWLQRFIAYFGDFNDVVGASQPILDGLINKQSQLIDTTKMLADVTRDENQASKNQKD